MEIPYVLGAQRRPVTAGESIMRQAFWTTQQETPQLPVNISYLSDAGDFTNGLYQVNSYTNYQNFTLPLESTFEVFNHVPGTNSIYLMFRYVVKATIFKPLEKAFDLPPRVPVLTTVVDFRFGGLTELPYDVSDRFLSKEEATHTPNYESVVLMHSGLNNVPKTEIRGRGGRFFILLIMAATSLVFLTLVVRNLAWKKNKNKKDNT